MLAMNVTNQPRNDFGLLFVVLREQRGWSQRDVARLTGIDRGMVSRIEGGERNPGRRTVEKLIKLFRFTPYEADLFRVEAGYAPLHHDLCVPGEAHRALELRVAPSLS